MAEHINRIENNNKIMPHYLGIHIQNEIISLLGEKIKKTIINSLKSCKYYTIILDCTPDISHEEQITIVVRFVSLNEKTKLVDIREHFLGFCPVTDTTGKGLTAFIVNFLKNHDIEINDMRGQGYDNGANMKGKHNGLQKHILDLNPRAFFVPCAAHSLNLVVNDAAKSSFEISNFFSIVQEIYVFFSASTHRWQVLKNKHPSLTVKPLSETRWESRIDAIKVLRYNLEKIYDALYKLYIDSTRDNDTRNVANTLLMKISSYKFICSIVIWYSVLTKINVVSKMMQKKDVALPNIVNMLKDVDTHFKECRSENGFKMMLQEAKKIAEEIDCETTFPTITNVRPRKKKRMFDYESKDENVESPEKHFKVNFYFILLDITISKIQERFEQLNSHNDTFNFLNDINSFLKLEKDTKLKYCVDLQNKLSVSNVKSDINAIDLYEEIENLSVYVASDMNALDILQYLLSNDLINIFPNLSISLRILLTMPVTVATGERSFSKLKIIKNYLRSTMKQERLTNLSIISIEREISKNLDITDIVNEFSIKKSRKVQFN